MYNFKIHTTMIQALAISNSTVVRATVIAQRTNSEEIGIIKAMMIAQLKEKLANGVAHFIFIKKNGEVREAWGTTSPSLAQKHINGNGISRECYNTTAYFDIEKGGWRSLRWESIVKVF
jgi:hypothetical protein